MWSLLLVATLLAQEPSDPSPLTLAYYNARLAQRERRPADILKLWLLHNALLHQEFHNKAGGESAEFTSAERGRIAPSLGDFRSLVWTATAELGVCMDGFPDDLDGAGLWPLAMHNWLLRAMRHGEPSSTPAPFDAFDVSVQRRFVTLTDVLSAEELQSFWPFRSECKSPPATARTLTGRTFDLKNRLHVARALHRLLQLSRTTLQPERVRHRSAIEARIFDLNLTIAQMAQREARREAKGQARTAKGLGVAPSTTAAIEKKQAGTGLQNDPEQEEILRGSLSWSVEDWLALSVDRRRALFAQALPVATDRASVLTLILGIIDALTALGRSTEVESWIAMVSTPEELPNWQELIFSGDRGERLMTLTADTGFRERAVIALHRGAAYLARGELGASLRSFAFALHHSEKSKQAGSVAGLGRRWLSFVLSRHDTTEEVLATLSALVPKDDYQAVIEDLVWRAAFHADRTSFELCTKGTRQGSAFTLRANLLQPLARRDLLAFRNQIDFGLTTQPALTLRFLWQVLERLERESGEVRVAHIPTLDALLELTTQMTFSAIKSLRRPAEALVARLYAIRDGVASDLDLHQSPRRLAPGADTFAGSIRVPPQDLLPWPFSAPTVISPSPFSPLTLTTLEWPGADGQLVYGWKVSE